MITQDLCFTCLLYEPQVRTDSFLGRKEGLQSQTTSARKGVAWDAKYPHGQDSFPSRNDKINTMELLSMRGFKIFLGFCIITMLTIHIYKDEPQTENI